MKIKVFSKPIAAARPRFVSHRGGGGHAYNPQETIAGKWLLSARSQLPEKPLTGPLEMSCLFVFPRTKSHFRTGKYSGILKDSAPLFHIQKPDLSNCLKFVEDCLNKEAYGDDSQIVESHMAKRWTNPGEECFTEIFIDEMPAPLLSFRYGSEMEKGTT